MFSEKRIIRVSPENISKISEEVKEDLEASGCKVSSNSGITGNSVLTISGGGFIASLFWLKRDAKISMSGLGDKIVCDVEDSFFLVNLLSLGPSWFLFPIPIITFIVGLIKQRSLKTRIFESVNAAAYRGNSCPQSVEKHCPECGERVTGSFCTKCGAKQ